MAMESIVHIAKLELQLMSLLQNNCFTNSYLKIGGYIVNTALPLFIDFFVYVIISLLLITYLYFKNNKLYFVNFNGEIL